MSNYYINTTLDGTTTSVTGAWMPLYFDRPRTISFEQWWNDASGTLAGTTTIEITNDDQAFADTVAGATSTAEPATDISSSLTITSPTSGEGSQVINISFGGWRHIRLKCARSSGSGLYRVRFSMHAW